MVSSSSSTTATTPPTPPALAAAKTAAKRARAAKHQRARLLALAAVLDDLAERACPACAQLDEGKVSATCSCDEDGIATQVRPVSADEFLARAVGRRRAVSSGAAVCALVYVGRVHAVDGLRRGNAGALLLGALALAASYVDRCNAMAALGRAAGVSPASVALLRDKLVVALKHRTYISPATYREFDAILDDLAR